MRIIRDVTNCSDDVKGAVVALGNFDGVHRGHQEILRQCVALARSYNVPAAVMTFEPHPREFFAKQPGGLRLCSFRRKVELLGELGVNTLFVVRFNQRFAAMTAETFVADVLQRELAVKQVVTGYNFGFGKDRIGTTEFLSARAREAGFGYTACPPVQDAHGNPVSSSAIRALLVEGNLPKASELLGHEYIIEGHVRHGAKRGRELGYPTANIAMDRLFKPRYGVYAVRVVMDGGRYNGVANIGVNPMFEVPEPLLEVYIFGLNRDIYGNSIQVECVGFIRDEAKFDSRDALKAQMAKDCAQAKQILSGDFYAGP